MKKINFTTTKQMSVEDLTKFRISFEVDFNLNIVINKVKELASRCSSLSDYEEVSSLVDELNELCDLYLTPKCNENETKENSTELA